MFYNERDVIDIYEKRYTLQDILWMNEDGRLLFAPTRRTRNMTRNIVKNAVEANKSLPSSFIHRISDATGLCIRTAEWRLSSFGIKGCDIQSVAVSGKQYWNRD